MKEILPILLVLVCPLMMIFMMRGMHGVGDHGSAARPRVEDDMSAAELRRLRDEIDRRIKALDERVRNVEATSGTRHDGGAGA
jgi:hypothetical protein